MSKANMNWWIDASSLKLEQLDMKCIFHIYYNSSM